MKSFTESNTVIDSTKLIPKLFFTPRTPLVYKLPIPVIELPATQKSITFNTQTYNDKECLKSLKNDTSYVCASIPKNILVLINFLCPKMPITTLRHLNIQMSNHFEYTGGLLFLQCNLSMSKANTLFHCDKMVIIDCRTRFDIKSEISVLNDVVIIASNLSGLIRAHQIVFYNCNFYADLTVEADSVVFINCSGILPKINAQTVGIYFCIVEIRCPLTCTFYLCMKSKVYSIILNYVKCEYVSIVDNQRSMLVPNILDHKLEFMDIKKIELENDTIPQSYLNSNWALKWPLMTTKKAPITTRCFMRGLITTCLFENINKKLDMEIPFTDVIPLTQPTLARAYFEK